MNRTLNTYDDLATLSRVVAERIAAESRRGERLMLCLSGGSTPEPLFEFFAGDMKERIRWDVVHLFWADERFVPPDDESSNERMARELFIDAVPIPPEQVHPVPTRLPDVQSAAIAYDTMLQSYFGTLHRPSFDVALLGIGEDGHTASLFPGQSTPNDRYAAPAYGPPSRPPRERITLTPALLNRSRHVYFLAAGSRKRDVVARVLEGDRSLPASRIHGVEETVIFADRSASPESPAGLESPEKP